MKIDEWNSTNGSKYHIAFGVFAGLVGTYLPLIFLGFAWLYAKYQRWDMETTPMDTQQKAWDICEFIIGAMFGIIIGLLIIFRVKYL